jgi:serine O-acetyltransferase
MEDLTFEELLKINCFSEDSEEQSKAAELLERRYCCEIRCANMRWVDIVRTTGYNIVERK